MFDLKQRYNSTVFSELNGYLAGQLCTQQYKNVNFTQLNTWLPFYCEALIIQISSTIRTKLSVPPTKLSRGSFLSLLEFDKSWRQRLRCNWLDLTNGVIISPFSCRRDIGDKKRTSIVFFSSSHALRSKRGLSQISRVTLALVGITGQDPTLTL